MTDSWGSAATIRLEEQSSSHRSHFNDCYGPGPAPRLFFAPGRVNLFGGHLDYNGGPVMPMAVDRGTLVAVRPRNDRRVRLASSLDPKGVEVELDRPPDKALGRWVDYPLGVLRQILARAPVRGADGVGLQGLVGLDILFGGNLPIGAGLSSSASLCVATALALDQVWGVGLNGSERVNCALAAEREFVGVQCGIMDPYAVGLARPGHVLWLDCRDLSWEHVPMDMESLVIAVANTGVQRELAAGAFNERVAQCVEAFEALKPYAPSATCLRDIPQDVVLANLHKLRPKAALRAQHVAAEVLRAFDARAAILSGDLARAGEGMTATHRSLATYYECSSPELDLFVDAAVEHPACFGSRLTGAGFGGCTVMMLAAEGAEEAIAHVAERSEAVLGRRPVIERFAGDEGPRELLS